MRIGLDLHVLDGKFQGTRTHVLELFSRVAEMCPHFRFICFVHDAESFRSRFPSFDLPNVEPVGLPRSGAIRRLTWDLPLLQRGLAIDLFHAQYITPIPSRTPTMVTVHDVLFESHPEFFPLHFRFRSRFLMGRSMRGAARIFTVSKFSEAEICKHFRIDRSKILVVPNAVDHNRYHPGPDGKTVLAKFGLQRKGFILTVGRLDCRKNHDVLLEAHARLGDAAPMLVIVGQKDYGAKETLDKADRAERTGRVRVLQSVSDDELPALYRNCLAFAFPSSAEGFGMPPLEAMASGAPTIVAENTALPEVVGSAGLVVRTHDVSDLAFALNRVVTDPGLRRTLAQRGFDRAKEYSWDKSASLVAREYRRFRLAMGRATSGGDSRQDAFAHEDALLDGRGPKVAGRDREVLRI